MHLEEQYGMQDNMVEHYDDCGEYVAELMDDEYYTIMEEQGGQENTGAGESVDSEGERINRNSETLSNAIKCNIISKFIENYKKKGVWLRYT